MGLIFLPWIGARVAFDLDYWMVATTINARILCSPWVMSRSWRPIAAESRKVEAREIREAA